VDPIVQYALQAVGVAALKDANVTQVRP